MARPAKQAGFSLLEVMLAFALFVVVAGAIMQTLGLSMRATRVSEEVSVAALWAQTKLDQIGLEEPLAAGQSSGSFDPTYRYELSIQPYLPENSPAAAEGDVVPISLFQVELRVLWKDRIETFRTVRGRLKEGAGF